MNRNSFNADAFGQGDRIPKKPRYYDNASHHFHQQQSRRLLEQAVRSQNQGVRGGTTFYNSNPQHDHHGYHHSNDHHDNRSIINDGDCHQTRNRYQSSYDDDTRNGNSYYQRPHHCETRNARGSLDFCEKEGQPPRRNCFSSVNDAATTATAGTIVPFFQPIGDDGFLFSLGTDNINNQQGEQRVTDPSQADSCETNHPKQLSLPVSTAVTDRPQANQQRSQPQQQASNAGSGQQRKPARVQEGTSPAPSFDMKAFQEYEKRANAQLPPQHRSRLPPHEFPPGWDDKKATAAATIPSNGTFAAVFAEELNRIGPQSDQQRAFTAGEKEFYASFVRSLPNCLPLTIGFHTVLRDDLCFCPCHPNMAEWRKSVGVVADDFTCTKKNRFSANALIVHLKAMKNIYHKLVFVYLEELYRNFYDMKVTDDKPLLHHKDFYPCQSDNYNAASKIEEAARQRAMQHVHKQLDQEKQQRELEKQQKEELQRQHDKLNEELEKLRKEANPEKAERMKRFLEFSAKFQVEETNEWVSGETIKSLGSCLFAMWKSCYINLGMASGLANENIIFRVQQDINVQGLFDSWYLKANASPLFRNYDGDDDKRRHTAKQLLMLSTIELLDDKVLGLKDKNFKEEITGKDAGGLTRQFFSQVWRQMGNLQVRLGDGVTISLFDAQSDVGCIPMSNAVIKEKLKKYSQDKRQRMEKKVKAFYRAIGRLMIHWIATDPAISFEKFENPGGEQCGHTIAANAMPPFYVNVLLRGINPNDLAYPLGDLGTHLLQFIDREYKDKNEKQELLKLMFELSGNAQEDEKRIRTLAQEWWVEGRSIAINALREGLTLDGCVNLVPVLRFAPFGAINRIIFSRSDIELIDVLDAIDKAGPPSVDDNMLQHVHAQVLLVAHLKHLLTERSSIQYKEGNPDKANFLGQFVNFCTGQWTIPSADYHGDFMIKIEFADKHPDSLPESHTCDKSIVFPGCAYDGNCKKLEEKLDKSVALTQGRFSMQ